MNTLEFLSYLRSLDIKVSADGDRMRLSAPKGVLTPTLREQLAERKAEILAFLNNANRSANSILTPLQPVARNENLPLSSAQKQLWFLDQLQPDSSAYNISLTYRLTGQLNVVALEQGLIEIVRRHEALRTTFASVNGEPIQVITQEINFSLPIVDLRNLPATEREAEAQRLVSEEGERPFDLATGPLWRTQLLHLDQQEYLLLVTMHHSVSDGWSISVFEQELAALYEAFCTEKPSPLPELPIQYADFAHWQQQWLQSEDFKSQLDYWKQQLGGKLPMMELPTDRPRPPVQSEQGANRTLILPQKLSEALKDLSRQEGATLAMTLMAGFKTLLYRYTGQEDIIVGSPVAARNRAELERLIGFLISTVVIRSDLSGNPSFRELLCRVRQVALEAYAHQDVPFEKLVEALQPERDLSRTPIFQVWFNMLNFGHEKLQLFELKVESVPIHDTRSKFDLTLYVQEQTQGIGLKLVYNAQLFKADTMQRMLGHYQTLLQSIIANPEQQISTLPLLTKADFDHLASFRNTVSPTNPFIEFRKQDIEQSISARFEEQVRKYPNNIAVCTKNYQWTYSELAHKSNQIAQAISQQSTSTEARIALLFEHDAPMIAGILGVLKAGKTYIPLDPNYPPDRVIYILENSCASILLTNHKNLERAKELTQSNIPFINIDEISFHENLNQVQLDISPDTIAYILYTSGSTGKPKGVIQNHRNVLHFIKNYTNNLHIHDQDRLTLLSSYSFDAAVMDIFGALLNGATLYPINIKEDGLTYLSQWVLTENITIYHSTPTLYRYFVSTLTEDTDFSKIRLVVLGGEEVVKKDIELYTQYFSDECIFINGLGPTESTVTLQYFINKQTEIARNTVPVGYPIDETEIIFLNEAGEKTDIYGEIAIKSAYVAIGYWQNPNVTQAVFLPDREDSTKRIYRTGDMGRLKADGMIEFLGRKDFQVKIRGFRIELGEIESILHQHPSVKEAVVIAREDIPGNKYLAAYIVPNSGCAIVIDEMRGLIKDKLPDYMIPAALMSLEALPLTPSGKIDRLSLPAPDYSKSESEDALVAPRNELEKQLTLIWEQVLGVKPIGVKDNFFDLGGHSLLTLRLLDEIEKTLNTKLPLAALFQLTTVEKMASFFQQENRSAGGSTQEPILDSATATELLNDSSPEYSGLTTEEYRTLLAIVAGRKGKRPRQNSLMVAISEQGVKPPLFFCANASEEALPLAKNLGKEQPFYFLESGLVVTGNVESKIKALAAHHVKDILLIQPEPPYLLCGYSFGAVLIDEIAQQLLAKGKQVSLVVLLDRYGVHPIYKLYRKLVIFMTDHLHHLAPLSFRDKLRYIQENLKRQISKRLPKSTNGEKNRPPYIHQAYPGKVILFCCIPNKHDSVPPDRQIPIIPAKFTLLFFRRAGWDKRIKPDLEIITVPGDHISMQEEPHVKVLAEKLQVCLDRAVIKTE